MLTLLLACVVSAPEPLPCPRFAEVLPVPQFVDDTPALVVAATTPQVVYRLGSLPPNFTPPNPAAYNPLPFYAPTYTYPVVGGYAAPTYCLPGR